METQDLHGHELAKYAFGQTLAAGTAPFLLDLDVIILFHDVVQI